MTRDPEIDIPEGDDPETGYADDRAAYIAMIRRNLGGLMVISWIPAVLLFFSAIAIYFTEDDSPTRFIVVAGAGIGLSLVLHGLLLITARITATGPAQRPGVSKPGNPWAWLVLAAVGAALVAWGGVMAQSELAFSDRAISTPARVLSIESTGSEPDSGARGTVQYTTEGGETLTGELDPLPTADLDGETIEVRYDPQNPEDVRSAHELSTWGPIILLLLAGVPLTVGSVIGAWRRF